MEKMTGESLKVTDENIKKIAEYFPEAMEEGKIKFDVLKELLGEFVDEANERYEFTWNGKSQALKLSQTPSTGTLLPCKEKSKDWNTTENIYIEGDNLEVLKLLEKSYYKKIKMIYIDPPYNTGSDFIYEDDFKDNIKKYKEITNQKNKANPETNGRYHTDWLNMLYPRLRIAKNILKDDGVIFISIDDHEQVNLRKICDEIFGENNFITDSFILDNLKGKKQDNFITTVGSRLLVYAKNKSVIAEEGFKQIENVFGQKVEEKYKSEDECGLYTEMTFKKTGSSKYREDRPYMYYPILEKNNILYAITDEEYEKIYDKDKKIFNDTFIENLKTKYNDFNFILPISSENEYLRWTSGFNTFKNKMNRDIFYNNGVKQKSRPEAIEILNTYASGTPKNIMYKSEYSMGTQDLKDIIPKNDFDFPKPVQLIRDLINMLNLENEIVLDFFGGSSTTAEAVLKTNSLSSSNTKFILVQLPEKIEGNTDFKTICEIGEERIRRASEKIKEATNADIDYGFKVFKLESSNLKLWNGDFTSEEEANNYFLQHLNPLVEGRTNEDLLYELLLKEGMTLTSPIEEIQVGDKTIYSIGMGYLMICLEDKIDMSLVEEIGKRKPESIIFRDSGFADENAKINTIQELKKYGIAEEVIKSI